MPNGLQPTYKELKHERKSDFYVWKESLQPTYKELKWAKGYAFGPFVLCLQPTYKELKFEQLKGVEVEEKVYSLPIRN